MTNQPDRGTNYSPFLRSAAAVFALGLLISSVGLATASKSAPGPDPAATAKRSMTLAAPPPTIDDKTEVLADRETGWTGWVSRRHGGASQWEVQNDGSVQVKPGDGDAISERQFGDFQLHLEFRCPSMPEAQGQGRGNSGIYLHGRYEVQVLDSYNLPLRNDGCGAIYSIATPLVNASLPPAQWQTYDIVFRAPRFDDAGEVSEFARITVLQNGLVIHNNLELPHSTPGGMATDIVPTGPILLQDHGNPVRYRNIWVRDL